MPPTLGTALSETIQRLIAPPERLDDRTLLNRFASTRDEISFGVLVRRHGGLVFDVCRNVLRDSTDAEDAFQTTFITLARQANRLGRQGSLAGWLHTTAYRAALNAKRSRSRRRSHESRQILDRDFGSCDLERAEEQTALHEEVERLPERYRAAIVLYYLTGQSQEQVGESLGLTKDGVKKRLQRGRDLLGKALTRRGFGASSLLAVAASSGILPDAIAQNVVRLGISRLENSPCSGLGGFGEFMMTFKSAAITGSVMLTIAAGAGYVWMDSSAKLQTQQLAGRTVRNETNADPDRVTEEILTIPPREISEPKSKTLAKATSPYRDDKFGFIVYDKETEKTSLIDKLILAAFPNDDKIVHYATKLHLPGFQTILIAEKLSINQDSGEVILADALLLRYSRAESRYRILFSGRSEKITLKFEGAINGIAELKARDLLSATLESETPVRIDFRKP